MKKLKMWLMKLVAKRIINKTTGEEKWETSKGRLGAVIYFVVTMAQILTQTVFPEWGIEYKVNENITDFIYQAAQAFGISLAGYGIRDAIKAKDES